MKSSRRVLFLTASTAGLATFTLPPNADARPVAPGVKDVPLTGVSSTDVPVLSGQTLARQTHALQIEDNITSSLVFDGALETSVVREPTNKLTFVYRLLNNTTNRPALGEVFRLTTFNIEPRFETDVDYLSDSEGDGHPSQVSRGDNWIDFNFKGSDTLIGQENSRSFFVRTNAVDYDTGGFAITDAFTPAEDPFSGHVRSGLVDGLYRPVIVPLPTALYTGAIGLATLYIARGRLRRIVGSSI